MEALASRAGDPDVLATCTPVYVQAPLLGKTQVTHRALSPLMRLVADRYLLLGRESDGADGASMLARIATGGTRTGGYFAGGINHLLGLAVASAVGGATEFVLVDGEADLIPALRDGRIDWAVATPVELATRNVDGAARPLAAIAPERLARLPDLPTLGELGVPVGFSLWRGVCAPPGLDDGAFATWRRVLDAALGTDAWRRYLAANGQVSAPLEAAPFATFLNAEEGWYRTQMAAAGVLPQEQE